MSAFPPKSSCLKAFSRKFFLMSPVSLNVGSWDQSAESLLTGESSRGELCKSQQVFLPQRRKGVSE